MNFITDLDKATYMLTFNLSMSRVEDVSVLITQNRMKHVCFVSQWNLTELSQ